MKMKMYQVPVTEMYAVRAQVIMVSRDQVPGDGEDLSPEEPFSAPSRVLM